MMHNKSFLYYIEVSIKNAHNRDFQNSNWAANQALKLAQNMWQQLLAKKLAFFAQHDAPGDYAGWPSPVTDETVTQWEFDAWQQARDDERTQRSEQVAEHGYIEGWAWENPADFEFQEMPAYFLPFVYPTVEAGWEWPFEDYDSTQAFREALRQQSNDFPF